MSKLRANSSPELLPQSASSVVCPEEHTLEGVATNIKLLLKLVQDHNEVGNKGDGRRMQRVAGMITILDDVKHRIQKSEPFGKRREAELRRCNTEIRRTDEEERLRKELSASLAARKSLEKMFSSLGKEKEIMVSELARKVQELNDTEEHLNDVREQNEKLLAKVKLCAAEHKERNGGVGGEAQGNTALQEKNKALSDQLLKYLDGYRSLKRKLKDAQEENATFHAKMADMTVDVRAGLNKIHEFQQRITEEKEQPVEIEEELSALEHMFRCFEMKVSKDCQKRGECVKPKAEINAGKPPVLA